MPGLLRGGSSLVVVPEGSSSPAVDIAAGSVGAVTSSIVSGGAGNVLVSRARRVDRLGSRGGVGMGVAGVPSPPRVVSFVVGRGGGLQHFCPGMQFVHSLFAFPQEQ